MIDVFKSRFKKDVIKLSFVKSSFNIARAQFRTRIFNSLNEKWKEEGMLSIRDSTISEIESKSDNKVVEVLVWKPKLGAFNFVVFFTNMSDGWDTLLRNYARVFNEEVISIQLSQEKAKYPVYSFDFKKGESQRLVRSMKEIDKWEFFEKGEVCDFENVANYRKRKIADRINNELIIGYLKKNGINIEVNEFWISQNAVRFYTDLSE